MRFESLLANRGSNLRANSIRAWLNSHYPALEHPLYVRLLGATAFSSLGSQFTVLALGVLPVLALVDPLMRWLSSAGALQITSLAVCSMGVLLYITAKVREGSVEKKEEPSG